MKNKVKKLESKIIHTGKMMSLHHDKIELPDGQTATRDVISHPGATVILPYLGDGKMILTRQYRYPINETILEFPAGCLEANEQPELCAQRELQEEISYKAGTLKSLGYIYPSPGFCDEIQHFFFATDLEKSALPMDADEILEPVVISISEFENKMLDGSFVDGKSMAIFLKARMLGVI